MGKGLKRMLAIGVAILVHTAFDETVFAENQLSDITIEVELQEDGTGIVTEYRQMNMDEGTELFIVLDEMQDSELLDFTVAGFEEVEEWDSDASLEEKAGKYGIIETDDGLELVWGIGEYGENDYEVTYMLSNLVRELEDGQGLLWNFDTFSDIPAENLTVEISGYEPFTEENVRFWGFGFEGDMQLVWDRIVWEATEEVDNSNDVTVLLQFPPGLFAAQASVDMSLDEQLEMAMDGSAYNDEPTSNTIPIIIVSVVAVIGGGAVAGTTAYYLKVKKAKEEAGQMQTGTERVKANKDILYENIPYRGDDLAGIAYLLQEFKKGYFEDYFSAYMLKWATEERIQIKTAEEKSVFGDKFDTEINILHYEEERNQYPQSFDEFVENIGLNHEESYETGMWLMLLDAADRNGLVNDERIKKWAEKYAKEVEEFADYLIDYSKDYLEEQGLIKFEDIEVWRSTQEVAIASTEGDKLFDRLVQFDNYLEEAELNGYVDEANPISIEAFLLWNMLYFRSEEITKQFKVMLPEPNDDYQANNFVYYYWYWNGMTGFRQNWSTGLASGGFHSSASSAVSGTGGATSYGGGAGAGGGGGGGAR